ncbi:hypothetical protein EKG37_17500 [Robertmurraya yapensis]|uniref:Prepilin type IV endopeptidase peptidase domain-containing protein n=3 Tax=Bacillaceae TaxID=186817 RepID=A0A431VYX2_9BACI|nr:MULTISPECIES: hypothetical protein [Bacillaceae]RTR28099.1 hypothetical protein EKG37_17500 [Bacillus yapensis]TKC15184.1 hypothetical protein FA727_20090 [Robertmurraya kyonggiensis]TKS94341.1 hypothetical protein FAR12_17500 [Bacillus yapensis]
MTTDSIIYLLFIYLVVNIWTDIRTLKTKNVWHLVFGLLILIVGIFNDMATFMLVALIIILLVGILLMNIPNVQLGAGDIKMLMVLSMYLQFMKPTVAPFLIVLILVSVYMTLSFLIHTILLLIKKRVKREISFLSYRVTKKMIITPEAIPISLSVFVAILFT